MSAPTESLTRYRCGCPDHTLMTAAGMTYGWPASAFPLKLAAPLNVPGLTVGQVTSAVAQACAAWEAVAPVKFAIVEYAPNAVNIVAFRADASSVPQFADGSIVALTQLPVAGQVNSTTELTSLYNAGVVWTVELLTAAIAHEFGHALGLVHIPNQNALMDPYLTIGRNTPQPPDIAALRALYPHAPTPAQPTDPPAAPAPPVPGSFVTDIPAAGTYAVAFELTVPTAGRYTVHYSVEATP